MDSLGNSLALIGTVLALVTVAAGVAAAFYVNLRRATVTIWREQAEALEKRLATVEASETECAAKLTAMAAANALLVDRISGTEAIAAFSATAKAQHSEIMAALWTLAAAGRAPTS